MTQSEAIKRLGTDDVVGQTLSVISRGKTRDLKITGILADLPKNSHIEATTIAHIDYPAFTYDTPDQLTCWGCQGGYSYLKIKPGSDPKAIEAGLPALGKAQYSGRECGQRAIQRRRRPGLACGQCPRRAYRPRAERRNAARQRRTDDHHLRGDRLADPRHGGGQLHQSCDRPRQPARPRSLAAQGAGSDPQAAHRPVHRRIDHRRGACDADRAGAGRIADAAVRGVPRCGHDRGLFRGGWNRLARSCVGADRWRAGRALSGVLPVALPAGTSAQGQQIGRGNARAPAGCAMPWSSPSSRFRSG